MVSGYFVVFDKTDINNDITYLPVLVNVFLLWWEYFTLKMRLDNTVEAQTLSADACNEHMFLILAILFTLFSVRIIVVRLKIMLCSSTMF